MAQETAKNEDALRGGYNFGTFKGVFTPSILTILGVVMYLRFGWAVGSVGLTKALVIITIASAITFLTGLSLSALATNMKVEGGGAYYIISRSLGLEAGAAVGLPLFFAQALGVSFYIAGFSESVAAEYPHLVAGIAEWLNLPGPAAAFLAVHDEKVIGLVALLVLTALAYFSADLALKTQLIIMALITVSLVSLFSGSDPTGGMPPAVSPVQRLPFWPVFAVIFPAVTGIEAGIAMSGDLKDPAKSLPRGTIAAVVTGYLVYVLLMVFLWFTISNHRLLVDYPLIMRYVARWGLPVLLGIWAASLSSTMGALLGAPRTMQALARDRVLPAILGRGYGKGNDPRIATALVFCVAGAGILLGDLNRISQVLSMFFLTSYGVLNLSAGLEELLGPPAWRPKFRVHWAVSLVGSAGCFTAMFMINAAASAAAIVVVGVVYFLMERRNLRAWWGDLRRGLLMLVARNAIYSLARGEPDERTWKPNILALTGAPANRWHLVELAGSISQDKGFLTVAAIVPEDTDAEHVAGIEDAIGKYLQQKDVPAIVRVYPADSALAGAGMLAKTYGYGPIAPDTILLGITEKEENYGRFAEFIISAARRKQNLVVFRDEDTDEGYGGGEKKQGGEKAEGEDRPEPKRERIDIWWYGFRQNLGYMLAIAYLLSRSPAWRGARMYLKQVVDREDDMPDARQRLETFISETRLPAAEAAVILREEGDIFNTIRAHSDGADMVFMGMRTPEAEERPADYGEYYADLVERTRGMPPTAMILASGETDFHAIFERLK